MMAPNLLLNQGPLEAFYATMVSHRFSYDTHISFEISAEFPGSGTVDCDAGLWRSKLDSSRSDQCFGQRQRVRRRLSYVITSLDEVRRLPVVSLEVTDRFQNGLEVATRRGRPQRVGGGCRRIPDVEGRPF